MRVISMALQTEEKREMAGPYSSVTTVNFCPLLLNEQNGFVFEKSYLASQQNRLFLLLPRLRPGSR